MVTETPIEDRPTRDIFELADGMRHWWNDDNADHEQRDAYELLRLRGHSQDHDRYVADLEECVRVLYDRYEREAL